MESRNFQLDTEWNSIHYPEKPNGFGILAIGDERNFVDATSSFWTQNEGKLALLNAFKTEGYTVFYSNLYGKNWGSQKAVTLAKRLYNHVTRTEILNSRIHLFAEGMGALVALKLMKEMEQNIRSVTMLNPIISLTHHLEHEKERKFFYKKMVKELSNAYGTGIKAIEDQFLAAGMVSFHTEHPVKIINILAGSQNSSQRKLLSKLSSKWEEAKAPVSICYMLPEKRQQLPNQILPFLIMHETTL